ncbi:hypothetical protein Tco_1042122 [Tanacetum coccineum]|uniref:Uncharacterized protein n=1 Tax=Tanacetum coccineum TaxID=301880 RepID=A0ABQ5GKH5_9ASTR
MDSSRTELYFQAKRKAIFLILTAPVPQRSECTIIQRNLLPHNKCVNQTKRQRIVKPDTPQSESVSEETVIQTGSEGIRKAKELLHSTEDTITRFITTTSVKAVWNQRTVTIAEAKETVEDRSSKRLDISALTQGICGHYARECRKRQSVIKTKRITKRRDDVQTSLNKHITLHGKDQEFSTCGFKFLSDTPIGIGSGYHQKDRKPSQNDKTEHGMEKTVQNQGQSPKMPKPI